MKPDKLNSLMLSLKVCQKINKELIDEYLNDIANCNDAVIKDNIPYWQGYIIGLTKANAQLQVIINDAEKVS